MIATTVRSRPEKAQLDAAFKALASGQRREILRILGEVIPAPGKTCCAADEVCGCKLSDRLGLAASTISHHMAILREAGLVTARKDGVWVYYSVRRDVLRDVMAELSRL
ncbi:MAG: metalloregulator ArsR/SmtB family transcription factor [Actinomycetia bacterium]|nr:metalloregulator ArsR/SmtB family transcription factor [Actinomycetes bacterium]